MEALFQQIAGTVGVANREACFTAAAARIDASLVCHELRNLGLARGERGWVSFRDLGAKEQAQRGEQFASPGEVIQLKSLQLDTTILVRAWASSEELRRNAFAERRACGEVRVPVHRLVSRCAGCLYHTWLLMDSPGLDGLATSIGLMSTGGDAESFDQALHNAPRQLFQPKVCLSIMRTADLPASGNPIWTEEVPEAQRSTFWSPLLLSQRQHMLMGQAMFLHDSSRAGSSTGPSEDSEAALETQRQAYEAQLAELRKHLDAQDDKQQQEVRQLRSELADSQRAVVATRTSRTSMGVSSEEVADLRSLAERQGLEMKALRDKLGQVAADREQKLAVAAEDARIASEDRQRASQETERLVAENRRLSQMLMERTQTQTQDLARLAAQTRSAQLDQSQALQRQHESATREVDDLRADKKLLLEEQLRLRDKVKTLEEIAHDRSLDIARQKDQLGSTIAGVKMQNARDLEDLRSEVELLRARLLEAEAQPKRESSNALQAVQAACDAQRAELTSLREASGRQHAALTTSQTAQDEADRKLDVANKQLWALKRERDEIAGDLDRARLEAQRVSSEKERWEKQFASVKADLDASRHDQGRHLDLTRQAAEQDRSKVLQMEAEHSQLKSSLSQLQREAERASASAAAERERWEKELASLKGDLDAARQDQGRHLDLTRQAAEQDRTKLLQMEAENSQLRGSLLQLQKEVQRVASLQATVETQRNELQILRGSDEKQRAEIQKLRKELDQFSVEGIGRMNAASDQVKAIQQSHDEALRKIERMSLERHELEEKALDLEMERDMLLEQKNALAEIVEDLHSSCLDAGLTGVAEESRRSIDKIFQGRGF
eukprot:TRINITY_DN40432_c0_g1_i1.p1 TRINITY_DN40432_c0_g1~~TRINITY_DN40432_c0_g1_i1.p1  ORF type:complete len:841 (+),score=256.43 TRINITY_DN40432_c0_g1_i1:111-2633(+)